MAAEWVSLLTATVGTASAFVGIYLGARLTASREYTAFRRVLRERQLRELYGPLLAIRSEIFARSQYRAVIEAAIESEWRDHVSESRAEGEFVPHRREEFRKSVDADIAYNKDQWVTHLLPLYRRMLDAANANLALAEPDLIRHLPQLVCYLEHWDRTERYSMPYEVAARVAVRERTLYTLYEHIARHYFTLQQELGIPGTPNRVDELLRLVIGDSIDRDD